MSNISVSILSKFANSPGLCSIDELKEVELFINTYIELRDLYKESFNNEPIGLTLESKLDIINKLYSLKN